MSSVHVTPNTTPTITAGAYSSGDALGGKLTFMLGSLSSGVIQSLRLVDLAKQNAEIDLVLFGADFSATADNAVFDPSDADLANCLGAIKIANSSYASFNDSALASVYGIGLTFQTGSAIYGQLVVRGTPTYASTSDISLQIGILLG
ncbi:MAG: hypothetical protein SGI73_18435 [Chloroflexota bacterium]|mgnify:CR=1 FL=1|nr:hypothetical protein [Chloroflexota bacterium]